MANRKIETGCYAIIRATGVAVRVGKAYRMPGCTLFATDCGGVSEGEYQASELRRIDKSEFIRAEETAEEYMVRKAGF